MLSNLHLSTPLIGLAFEPQSPSPHASSSRDKDALRSTRTRGRSPSPYPVTDFTPSLAWFPVQSSFATSSSAASSSAQLVGALRRSLLNPETPAFEPLSPPDDSSLKALQTSPNRRRTLELPPSPPDSPPDSTYEPLLSFARPKSKASRGRAPTRSSSSSSDARARSSTSTRRSRTASTPYRPSPTRTETSTILEEDEDEVERAARAGSKLAADDAETEDDDERFSSLPLLRLRHRLSTSLTLSTYPSICDDKVLQSVTSLPSERSTSPNGNPRRRRSFPPGTVWAEQSHYRLYALQKSKADRTSGVGYWKRWEGVDLE